MTLRSLGATQGRIQRGFSEVARIPLLAKIISFSRGFWWKFRNFLCFCLELFKTNRPFRNPASNPATPCATSNFSLRGDFLLLTKFILRNCSTYYAYFNIRKRCENYWGSSWLGYNRGIEVRIDQGSNWPMKRCELTKVEMTKDRVDHKPLKCSSTFSLRLVSSVTIKATREDFCRLDPADLIPGEWLSFRRFTSNYPDPDPGFSHDSLAILHLPAKTKLPLNRA